MAVTASTVTTVTISAAQKKFIPPARAPRGVLHLGPQGRERLVGHADQASGRTVEVEHDQQEEGHKCAREHDGGGAAPVQRRVEGEQAEGEGGAEYLQREDGAGNAVVERSHPHGLLVDHLVQGLDVEPRRAVLRRSNKGVAGQAPEPALERTSCATTAAKLSVVGTACRARCSRRCTA